VLLFDKLVIKPAFLFFMEQQRVSNTTVREAGARGGATTYARYGKEHFQAIGRKGQAALATKITSDQRRAWGAMGGRPRKRPYLIYGGEVNIK